MPENPPTGISSEDLLAGNLRPLLRVDKSNDEKLTLIYRCVTAYICVHGAPEFQEERLVNENQFKANITQQESQFLELFRKAIAGSANSNDRMELLKHSAFRASSRAGDKTAQAQSVIDGVVERAWTVNFVGNLDALEQHVERQMKMSGEYVRTCSIVQSSGAGKSRLMDELAKHHFLIPINLRADGSTGFPPADKEVRDFFIPDSDTSLCDSDVSSKSFSRARHFLRVLFITAAKAITSNQTSGRAHLSAYKRAERIRNFRVSMSRGQKMDTPGNERTRFYRSVIDMAKENMNGGNVSDEDMRSALKELQDQVTSAGLKKTRILPDVFLVFDEAHVLTRPFHANIMRTHLAELQRALQVFYNLPLFTFFLSASGKILPFTPFRPFIDLGFDHQYTGSSKVFEKYKSLDDVTSLDCIAHLGRPMWAAYYDRSDRDSEARHELPNVAVQKLLGVGEGDNMKLTTSQTYAVLSRRLALDINRTRADTFPFPRWHDQVEKEQEQIVNHMRTVASIKKGIESLHSLTASEPLLSEAAFLVMKDSNTFNLADALTDVMGYLNIKPEDLGKLLVSAFFTWARDRAVLEIHEPQCEGQLSRYISVNQLFSHLFSRSTFDSMSSAMPSIWNQRTTPKTFGQEFGDAFVHFNHFIVRDLRQLMNPLWFRSSSLAFISRGAAILTPKHVPDYFAVDAIFPFLYGDTVLDVQSVGIIIVRVTKNIVSQASRAAFFREMDPASFANACSLLDYGRGGKKTFFPIPIIRIVFALCDNEPAVTHVTYPNSEDGRIGHQGLMYITSYDFWCSGISPSILEPVKEAHEKWASLFEKVEPWQTFFESATNRSQHHREVDAYPCVEPNIDRWMDQKPDPRPDLYSQDMLEF